MNRPIAPARVEPRSEPRAERTQAEQLRPRVDVAVIGAGIIGLSIAWAVAQSGRTVAVIDRAPASGATYAAAGMVAPISELHYGEEALLELMLASAALYPEFIASLGGADAAAAGFRASSTLVVGADAADRQTLNDLRSVQRSHGLGVEALTVREARALEPALSPQLSSAFRIEDDRQLDPRWLAAQLQSAVARTASERGWNHDAAVLQNAVALLHADANDDASAVTGVLLDDGSVLHAREVIVANGLAAAQLDGLPQSLKLALRPVYGDILRLRVPAHLRPLLSCTIRGLVHGVPVYLVPRPDATVVLGATQREHGSAEVSAGGVLQLLRDAQLIVPAVSELELIEAAARARPATADNAPVIGRVAAPIAPARSAATATATSAAQGNAADVPGLILATGFFRHGVLLAPIAARICLGLLDSAVEERWNRFRADRFATASGPHRTRAGSSSASNTGSSTSHSGSTLTGANT